MTHLHNLLKQADGTPCAPMQLVRRGGCVRGKAAGVVGGEGALMDGGGGGRAAGGSAGAAHRGASEARKGTFMRRRGVAPPRGDLWQAATACRGGAQSDPREPRTPPRG